MVFILRVKVTNLDFKIQQCCINFRSRGFHKDKFHTNHYKALTLPVG